MKKLRTKTRIGTNSLVCSLILAGLPLLSSAQQYVYAPTSGNGVDGWVAGWMSNLPPGTPNQDWYPGAGVPSTCAPPAPCTTPNTHDTAFLSATEAQRVGGGLSIAPNPTYNDFQNISGLTANDLGNSISSGQFIEFPFTSGLLNYADGTPAPVLFYLNGIFLSKRWNINAGNPNSFGYGAYVVDSSGNPVGGIIQQINNVGAISGADFQVVRTPDGPGPGIELQPNTPYALRFYLYRAGASNEAVWDDTLLSMSRQAIAELQVTTTPITTTPAGGQASYSYTFKVYNNGPDTTTANISDPLPGVANGISASWSCTLQPSGNPCATASGTGIINSTQTLASGETAVYTVSWVGPGVTVPDTHTISALPTSGSPIDPISTNNTAEVDLSPPTIVAANDSVVLPTNTSTAEVSVTANDSGSGGMVDPNSVTVATPPTTGSVTCSSGICSYSPPSGGLTSPITYQYNVCLAVPNQTVCTIATVTVSPPEKSIAAVPLMGWASLVALVSLIGFAGFVRIRS